MKTCKTCKLAKLVTEFPVIERKGKEPYSLLHCISCDREKRRLKKNYARKNDLEIYVSKSLDNAKQRAKVKGFEFSLTKEWYIGNLPKYCPVFNTKLDFTSCLDEHKPSIDRVNSAKGYTEDNCKIISWKANNIKNQWTVEELEAVVNYLKQD